MHDYMHTAQEYNSREPNVRLGKSQNPIPDPISNGDTVCKGNTLKTDDDDDSDGFVDYRYGWCNLEPGWIQTLNRPRWLLLFLCLYTFIQGMIINGFINVVISTLEKRFDLTSTNTGLIASTYDIATAVLVVFVGYYGGRGNKARWLSFGCVIMAVGSFVFAIPHFTTGLYKTIPATLVCAENSPGECWGTNSSSLSNYLYVFMLAQVLHGIGCTPLFSIGITLIDESVSVHQSALYLGIFFSVAAIGPAAGYLIGGAFLSIYSDVGQVDIDSLDVTSTDREWVGAWWMGFIVGGCIAVFVAIPIGGYKKELPSTPRVRALKVSQAHLSSGGDELLSPRFGEKCGDFPRAIKFLFMNPTFVFLVLVGCSKGVILSGFATFGPKVIETQFGKTAGDAALLMGICTVPGAGFGTFLGGYLVKRWKLKVRGMIKFSCCALFATLVALLGLLLRCPQEYLVGVNADYLGNMTAPDEILVNDCNSECGCTRAEFNPVCGDNGLEYFDPCFAGCTASSIDSETFTGCACIALSGTNTSSTAIAGKCARDCGTLTLPLFLVALVMLMVFHFMATIPVLSSVLRCVPESQRSLALGVNWIFIRVLGTVPGPLVFGAALDSSCLLWQEDCAGNQGSCFLYNGNTVSWKLFLMGFGVEFMSLICLILALWCYNTSEDEAYRNVVNLNTEAERCNVDTNEEPF